jgi:hypothetical protein
MKVFDPIRYRSMACAALMALCIPCFAQSVFNEAPELQDAQNIAGLVTANHILADQGVVDGFGHISVRSVKNPNHHFISRSRW